MNPPRLNATTLVPGLLLCVLLTACDNEGPVAPPPNPEPRPRELRAQPSFALDIQDIFSRGGCVAAGCHAATAPQAGLVLTSGRSHAALVRTWGRAEGFLLVAPGNPDASYLIMRVEGRHQVGSRMPLGRIPLDSIDIGNLRNWILQGAENNE